MQDRGSELVHCFVTNIFLRDKEGLEVCSLFISLLQLQINEQNPMKRENFVINSSLYYYYYYYSLNCLIIFHTCQKMRGACLANNPKMAWPRLGYLMSLNYSISRVILDNFTPCLLWFSSLCLSVCSELSPQGSSLPFFQLASTYQPFCSCCSTCISKVAGRVTSHPHPFL